MKFKKQIGIIISCIAILAVVFLAVSYIGDKDNTASNKNDSNVIETGSNTNDKTDKETANETSNDETTTVSKTDDEKETAQKEEDSKVSEGIKEGYYTVKETDTLFSIAKAYMPNSDPTKVVETIKQRNNLTDDVISQGQKLIISYETALENQSNDSKDSVTATGDHASHKSYVVKEGDTLFSIAQKNMTSMNVMDAVEAIKAHNSIGDSDVIKVDQKICIPASEQ
ncbi:LysM peptidoglycan-binding domain-containing protein [Clostridium culturomicium]|uniref:LysM peptidoglycan-binding domain-containing protein n=1 Tax=Clostridium culturomicium TaxID=1499683 RepID=UPI0038574B18